MVQTILYVWLVLSSCVMERQFTEFRFLSGQYQKKGLQKQIQTSNTNVYLWENYLKLPSFSSHAAWQNCQKKKSSWHTFFFFTMTTLQSRSFWTGWKLQRETATCVTPWSALFKKKKKYIGSLSLFRLGPGVVISLSFLAKLSLYQTFHLSAMTPVFSTFEDISLV